MIRSSLALVALLAVAASVLRPAATANPPQPDLRLPLPTGNLTQCVQGNGDSFSHNQPQTQHALDLDDQPHTPGGTVVAAANGLAYVRSNQAGGWGNNVRVDHGNNYYTLYAHLQSIAVANGQKVSAGQQLGVIGGTAGPGRPPWPPHLHFALHRGDANAEAIAPSVLAERIWTRDATNSGQFKWTRSDEFSGGIAMPPGRVYEAGDPPLAENVPVPINTNHTSAQVYQQTGAAPHVVAVFRGVVVLRRGQTYHFCFGEVNRWRKPACVTLDLTRRFAPPSRRDPAPAEEVIGEYTPILVDDARFSAHTTIPDGTVLSPGQRFSKTWAMLNTGTTNWDSRYSFVYEVGSGSDFGPEKSSPVPSAAADAEARLSFNLVAPSTEGRHVGWWQLHAPDGRAFGPRVAVDIRVRGAKRAGERPDGSIDARIAAAFNRNGGAARVGTPRAFVYDFDGGQMQEFDGPEPAREPGVVMAKGGTAFWVHGAIYAKYDAEPYSPGIQGPLYPHLRYAVSDEADEWSPGGPQHSPHGGRRSLFEGGLIAHHIGGSRSGQTFEVHGAIYYGVPPDGRPRGYSTLGLGSWLGYPIGARGGGPSGPGQLDEFTNDAGERQSDFESGYITRKPPTVPTFEAYPYAPGGPTGPLPWDATYAYQTPYPTGPPGSWLLVEFGLKNTGTQTWTRDGTNRVHLGTTGPNDPPDSTGRDRVSAFSIGVPPPSGWNGPNRIRMRDDRAVPPGEHAYFRAWFHVPETFGPGVYREDFRAVADGGGGWFGPNLFVIITVGGPVSLFGEFLRQSPRNISLYPGQRATLWVDYENRGSLAWHTPVTGGQPFTVLGCVNSPGGAEFSSPFYIPGVWDSPTRPGNKSLTNAPIAPPDNGGLHTGHFEFQVQAPPLQDRTRPDNYDAHFNLFLDSDRIRFAGNSGVTWNITVTPDTIPPRLDALTFDPPSPSNAVAVNVNVLSSDAETGVREAVLAANDAPDGSSSGTWHQLGAPMGGGADSRTWNLDPTVYGDGLHRVKVTLTDKAGNETVHETTYQIDRAAPVVTLPQMLSATAAGENDWTTTPVSLQLSAEDPVPGTSVRDLTFAWDDPVGPGERYQTTFNVPEGQHTLFIFATDHVGNRSVTAREFKVDTGLPDSLITSILQEGLTQTVTLTAAGVDAVSPPLSMRLRYRLDDGAWTDWQPVEPVILRDLSYGTHTICVQSKDLAGNEDPTPAETTFAVVPPPPAAPSNLAVTPLADGSLKAAWLDNSANESGFLLERAASGVGTWEVIATLGPDATEYSDTAVERNAAYTYRVRATNAGGDSGATPVATGLTFPATPQWPAVTAPPAPEGTSHLRLTWSSGSSRPSASKIERSTVGGSFIQVAVIGVGVTEYTDTGLAAETTYLYRIRATNESGDSPYSEIVSGTTRLPAPSGLAVALVRSTLVSLVWADSSSSESGFRIERRGAGSGSAYAPIGMVAAGVTTFNDTSVAPCTAYLYRVWAYSAAGDSASSNEVSAETTLGISAFTINPPKKVRGGRNIRAQVSLCGPAPARGIRVLITSSHPGKVHVPRSVVVDAGKSSKPFRIETKGVRSALRVTVTVSYDGVELQDTLEVVPR